MKIDDSNLKPKLTSGVLAFHPGYPVLDIAPPGDLVRGAPNTATNNCVPDSGYNARPDNGDQLVQKRPPPRVRRFLHRGCKA